MSLRRYEYIFIFADVLEKKKKGGHILGLVFCFFGFCVVRAARNVQRVPLLTLRGRSSVNPAHPIHLSKSMTRPMRSNAVRVSPGFMVIQI